MLQKMISSGFIKQMEDPLIFCGLDTLKTIQL
jgi:predicted alpha/beta-fold hydrolase